MNCVRRVFAATIAAAMLCFIITSCNDSDHVGELPNDPLNQTERSLAEPVNGLSDDFIMGMDISSVIAEEQSGVTYRNAEGEPQDIFKTLSEYGVNYIRVRVWNDPYDNDGNGYGGGNCDAAKAAEIGRRAAAYGMKLLVDFHYSDFWADPTRQLVPKAWQEMEFEQKKSALGVFTQDSLRQIINAGADVGMVQVGNEINNGMAGESDNHAVMELLAEGSTAVRRVADEYGKEISVAVHYTDVGVKDRFLWYAQNLDENNIDYDIFGVSYYPYWHGGMENLTDVLSDISKNYGKKTLVLETSYPSTTDDSDGFGNVVGQSGLLKEYPASEQGQARCVRDVIAAAGNAGSIGVFYWEGAWITVGGSDFNRNFPIWEKYGSGWASSYSVIYDPDGVGEYYGGSSWDNQAFFAPDGTPKSSLNVFKEVYEK